MYNRIKQYLFKKFVGVDLIQVIEYQNWRIDELKEMVDWTVEQLYEHRCERHNCKPVKKAKCCKGKCKKNQTTKECR